MTNDKEKQFFLVFEIRKESSVAHARLAGDVTRSRFMKPITQKEVKGGIGDCLPLLLPQCGVLNEAVFSSDRRAKNFACHMCTH